MGSNMDKIYIVMNYVEHDLKSLMETMKQPFLPGTAPGLLAHKREQCPGHPRGDTAAGRASCIHRESPEKPLLLLRRVGHPECPGLGAVGSTWEPVSLPPRGGEDPDDPAAAGGEAPARQLDPAP